MKVVKALKRNDPGVAHAAIDMINALMQVLIKLQHLHFVNFTKTKNIISSEYRTTPGWCFD